ncbi:MAG: hypothetical protein ACRD1Z_06950, partial [Vicinamibacteria bacterium]
QQPAPEEKRSLHSVQGVARSLLLPRRRPSPRLSQLRQLERELRKLRDVLASPGVEIGAELDAIAAQRQRAKAASEAPRSPSSFSGVAVVPDSAQQELGVLWQEVDAFTGNPVANHEHLEEARRLLEDALSVPEDPRPPSRVLNLTPGGPAPEEPAQ